MVGLILLIVVLLILFGGVGWGYQGGNQAGFGLGGIGGLLLLILLVMLFLGHVSWY